MNLTTTPTLPAIPARASDAGPESGSDERTAVDRVSEAEEALEFYHRYRRANRQQDRDLKVMWLQEALRQLEQALEIEKESR